MKKWVVSLSFLLLGAGPPKEYYLAPYAKGDGYYRFDLRDEELRRIYGLNSPKTTRELSNYGENKRELVVTTLTDHLVTDHGMPRWVAQRYEADPEIIVRFHAGYGHQRRVKILWDHKNECLKKAAVAKGKEKDEWLNAADLASFMITEQLKKFNMVEIER